MRRALWYALGVFVGAIATTLPLHLAVNVVVLVYAIVALVSGWVFRAPVVRLDPPPPDRYTQRRTQQRSAATDSARRGAE